MKPLNHAERTTRLWKFTLFYLLALALPLAASYFLFADNSIAAENRRLKRDLEIVQGEQHRLLVQLDTLTNHLYRIDQTDQLLAVETNPVNEGKLNTKIQDNINSIAVVLSNVRADSAAMTKPTNKQLARNVLRDFALYRNNRNTIDLLRQALKDKGVNVANSEGLQNRLNQAEQMLATYQAAAANRPAPAPAPAPSGGGGGGGGGGGNSSANAGRLADLQRRLQETLAQTALQKDQISFANADCLRLRALDKSSAQRKEMLEQARKGFLVILQNPSTDNMKASTEKMVDAIDKELGRRRGLFSGGN